MKKIDKFEDYKKGYYYLWIPKSKIYDTKSVVFVYKLDLTKEIFSEKLVYQFNQNGKKSFKLKYNFTKEDFENWVNNCFYKIYRLNEKEFDKYKSLIMLNEL